MLTVTAVFILDSHELHNGTEKENTTKIDDSPKPFLQQILYNDNEPILGLCTIYNKIYAPRKL